MVYFKLDLLQKNVHIKKEDLINVMNKNNNDKHDENIESKKKM